MTEALWALVVLAAVAVVAFLLYRGRIRTTLKGLGAELEIEGDNPERPPGPGGIKATRVKAGQDLNAEGRTVEVNKGEAGRDMKLRANRAEDRADPKEG